jgi:glycine/D-amino acid oxidase-like deaminating enzyme
VGGGYTGLWTAYYLKKLDPSLNIIVVEAEFAGFGASGRNGGWLTNDITGGRARYLESHGRDAVNEFQRQMNASVDEVIRVAKSEGIDADIAKGGELNVAYTPAQENRLHSFMKSEQQWESVDTRLLSADESFARVGVHGTRAGYWHEHCARINPAKLVKGLASAVERLGVTIYESTRASEIVSKVVHTDKGDIVAQVIVRATEGFTAGLKGEHRTWLPMNSSLIVTEPLGDEVWSAVNWSNRETLGDLAHVYMYAQRTADDRIAIGGRGAPYRYGSRTDHAGRTPQRTVDTLVTILNRFFPSTLGVQIDHAWSGVLGVPRDWAATVAFERESGLASAGGYVGTGVTTTNLAGRTLADLITGRDTILTSLPWVDHHAKKWEVEPLRWLAVQAIYGAYNTADRSELRGRQNTSPIAHLADLVAGRH